MSVSFNRNKRNKKMKARLENMTISEFEKLRPDEVKGHKKIVDFIKKNEIKLKVN